MKRILSIQDLSCLGKCSQSIALPVLSCMGHECVSLPTALLSAHTVFPDFYFQDLTAHFRPITEHWKKIGLEFNVIYSGYLGSEAQISLVQDLIADFPARDGLIFVDPVMADHGRLYAGFDAGFPEKMRTLCHCADIITPNITEACLLTGTEYRSRHDEDYILGLLKKLMTLGVKTAILTGIRTDTEHMGVAAMDVGGSCSLHYTEFIPAVFHGTGDLFASTCVGALALGYDTGAAIALAADFVVKTITQTARDRDARWYGVNFETALPYLLSRLGTLPQKEEPL